MKVKELTSNQYWNSEKIVTEFTNASVPSYWAEFFESLDKPDTKKVLDLGCGGGRNTYMLASLGFWVLACDYHENMVEATKKKIQQLEHSDRERVTVEQANMLCLPYESDSVDVILANGVYHNTSSYDEITLAFRESVRILKTGGLLCLNIFTDRYIDPSLKKQAKAYLYITPDQLDMMLLPEQEIMRILQESKMYPVKEPVSYLSHINVGVRGVLRGVFQKTTNHDKGE